MLLATVLAFSSVAIAEEPIPAFYRSLAVVPVSYSVELRKSVMVKMRDGVQLSTDLYFPRGYDGTKPVILLRTPYNKNLYRVDQATEQQPYRDWHGYAYFFASRGYVVAVQDHRGRYESEGEFFPYPETDGRDGYDTIDWLVKQPWASGRVGTIGCSYDGETQHMLAARKHPNHTTAIAQAGSSTAGAGGVFNFGFARYGATELAAALNWSWTFGAGSFAPGPPAWVDRSRWFASEEAAHYATYPVIEEPPVSKQLAALRTLPVVDAMKTLFPLDTQFENWLRYAGEPRAPYWKRQGLIKDSDTFNVPTLHLSSWNDPTPNSTLKLFRQFGATARSEAARNNQFLIMAPATHCQFDFVESTRTIGDRVIENGALNYPAVYLAWFDYWLKGAPNDVVGRMPKVTSFVLGRDAWRTADSWPLPGQRTVNMYLRSGGRANSRHGDGMLSLAAPSDSEPADSFVYDPVFPVPTQGGPVCCAGDSVREGAVDQRDVEIRNDVLVYTSEPLTEPLEIAGSMLLHLQVSSSAKDTDFVAKISDVHPDGAAYLLQEGILRARWREGFEKPVWMQPGAVYPLTIDLEATHNYFAPGHRIRIDVTSSSFPRWDRNLNTGGANFDEATGVAATNSVHHTRVHPSYIALPVVPPLATSHR